MPPLAEVSGEVKRVTGSQAPSVIERLVDRARIDVGKVESDLSASRLLPLATIVQIYDLHLNRARFT
jgi:hypothetical protein